MCGITNKSTIIMLYGCSIDSIIQTGQQAAAQHLIAVLTVDSQKSVPLHQTNQNQLWLGAM